MERQKIKVPIRGMHCKSCEILIEDGLKTIKGVQKVSVSHLKGEAIIEVIGESPSYDQVKKIIKGAGYSIGDADALPWVSSEPEKYLTLLLAGSILFTLYFLAKITGLLNVSFDTSGGNVWVVVLVGLAAGFSSCMALVGGLILGFSARHAELHPQATTLQKFRPHLFFNAGRLIGYAGFGGLIGFIGSAINPSSTVLGLMTMAVGVIMIFFGLKLIDIFPILKNKTVTLPKSVSRFFGARNNSKEYDHASAFTAGVMTFFLPCGFTQTMQLYAVSTGSFAKGALIMFLFAVGTAPGLLGIGGLSSIFNGQKARVFFAMAGLAVILLGVVNVTNASRLVSFPTSGRKVEPEGTASVLKGAYQEVRMTQDDDGYRPNQFTIKKGIPVKWIINSVSQYSCANYIIMSAYDISQALKPGENVIEFTPTWEGVVKFSCSMGMYRGTFNVVDDGAAAGTGPARTNGAEQQKEEAILPGTQIIKAIYTTKTDIVPNRFTVSVGKPVRLEIEAKDDGNGCMGSVMIPTLYQRPQFLEKGRAMVLSFIPTERGQYYITCSMGTPRGIITVQ